MTVVCQHDLEIVATSHLNHLKWLVVLVEYVLKATKLIVVVEQRVLNLSCLKLNFCRKLYTILLDDLLWNLDVLYAIRQTFES